MHLPAAAPLSLGWKLVQTQDTQPQDDHTVPSTQGSPGIPTPTAFSFPDVPLLFLPSLSFFSSFLVAILSSFPPFFAPLCFTSSTKERISINQNHPHVQKVHPTAPAQWECVTFAIYYPLFVNLRCTALKNNTLKTSLLK